MQKRCKLLLVTQHKPDQDCMTSGLILFTS